MKFISCDRKWWRQNRQDIMVRQFQLVMARPVSSYWEEEHTPKADWVFTFGKLVGGEPVVLVRRTWGEANFQEAYEAVVRDTVPGDRVFLGCEALPRGNSA